METVAALALGHRSNAIAIGSTAIAVRRRARYRLTVLVQMTKGACRDPGWTERRLADLERLKWLLWHGHAGHAVEAAEGFAEDAWCMEEEASAEAKAKPARLRAAAEEFAVYLRATPVSSSTTESDTVPASASRPASSSAQLTRSSPNASPSANRCAGRSVAHTSHCKPETGCSTANWKTSSGGDGRRSGRPPQAEAAAENRPFA
jgi:hypothetical protein